MGTTINVVGASKIHEHHCVFLYHFKQLTYCWGHVPFNINVFIINQINSMRCILKTARLQKKSLKNHCKAIHFKRCYIIMDCYGIQFHAPSAANKLLTRGTENKKILGRTPGLKLTCGEDKIHTNSTMSAHDEF